MQKNCERLFFEKLRLAICRACADTLSDAYISHILKSVFIDLNEYITDDQLLWLLVEAELPAREYMYGTNPYMGSRERDSARWRLASIRERMHEQRKNQKPAALECLTCIEEELHRQEKELEIELARRYRSEDLDDGTAKLLHDLGLDRRMQT